MSSTIDIRRLDGERESIARESVRRLNESLQGRVFQDDSPEYEEARVIWNAMVDRRPALIACCRTAEDVQRVVTFAREYDILLAVRGGGHSFPGHSTCDGGLVLDLSAMKRITIDPTARTVRAEAGLRWSELDAATQQYGRAVTGGQVSHTGIAGLTVGGGIGWLARQFGLTIDHLQGANVVTADGALQRAAPESDSELFWAIRGGGGNFGVVTAFDYRLDEIGPLVTVAQIAYPIQEAATVFGKGEELLVRSPDSLTGTFAFLHTPEGIPLAALTLVSTASEPEAVRQIAPFRTIGLPIFEELVRVPYTALQSMMDQIAPIGLRYYARSNLLDELAPEIIEPLAAAYQAVPSPQSLMLFVRLGGAVARVGPSDTAFPHRQRSWSLTALGIWTDPADDRDNTRWIRETWDLLPSLPDAVYVNELADEGSARVRAAYGLNYPRLTTLKQKYDPNNLFRLNQNIVPA